jgi:hypothetical protein
MRISSGNSGAGLSSETHVRAFSTELLPIVNPFARGRSVSEPNSALPAAWASLEAPGAPVSWPGKVKALGEGQEPDAPGDGAGDGCVGVSLDRQVERQKQEDEPSRAEAIRRLVEQALKTKAK